jgi:hypothetical protein
VDPAATAAVFPGKASVCGSKIKGFPVDAPHPVPILPERHLHTGQTKLTTDAAALAPIYVSPLQFDIVVISFGAIGYQLCPQPINAFFSNSPVKL